MSQQKQSFPTRLVVAVAIAVGISGAYFYFRGAFISGSNPEDSAKVVPDEAFMAAYLVNDRQPWQKLSEFGNAESKAAIARGIESFKNEVFTANNLDYDRDLEPWVGNIMLAWLPAEEGAEPTETQPELLAVVGIKNPLRAWLFQRNLKSQENLKQQEIEYNGVTISEIIPSEGAPSYYTRLKNQLVLSDSRATVERAIDVFQGEPSLVAKNVGGSEDKSFKKLLADDLGVDDPLFHFYLPDYGSMMGAVDRGLADSPVELPETNAVQAIAIAGGVDNRGIYVRAISAVDPDLLPEQSEPVAGQLLDRLPSETIALVSGAPLAQTWSSLVAQSQTSPPIEQFVTLVRTAVNQFVKINADRDLFGWMDGEFAIGLVASQEGMLSQIGFGGALLFETSDRATAATTFNKLDNLARNGLPFPLEISSRTVNGIDFQDWRIPQQGAVVSYGWLDDNTVLLTLGGPIADAIAAGPSPNLRESDNFRAIAGSLPTPNYGYFYLDMDRAIDPLQTLLLFSGGNIPVETTAILQSIRGIGVTATWPKPEQAEMELLFALKKTKELQGN